MSEKQGNVSSPVSPKAVTFNEQIGEIVDTEQKVEVLHSITKVRAAVFFKILLTYA